MADVKSGLEGVVVAQSKMSKVLGDIGRLIYSGYEIHDLAEHASLSPSR
jgi:citrate synthase